MATYTVTISGAYNTGWCYATINGTKITEDNYGTHTYDTKPTISIRVGSYDTSFKQSTVTLNGEIVFTGRGTYDLVTDGTDINIVFTLETVSGSTYSAYFAEVTARTPDPMDPYDGHNTNIGQVARQIEAGTVLLGGVGREIESGLVLDSGVSREIELAGKVTVTVSGTTDSSKGYAIINGQKITAVGVYEYSETPDIVVHVGSIGRCRVYLNGEIVLNGEGDYTLVTDAKNIEILFVQGRFSSSVYYTAEITTS